MNKNYLFPFYHIGRLLLCLLLCMAGVSFSVAQEKRFFSQYSFQFITERMGLPHGHVSHITQDTDGYIWAATPCGIARYDGYEIYTFDTQSTPIRLKNERINQLCEDDYHRLWIGSEGGLDIIDLDTYTTLHWEEPADSALLTLSRTPIYTIYKDGQGSIWLSSGHELWCLTFDAQGGAANWYKLQTDPVSPIGAITNWAGRICAAIGNRPYLLHKGDNHRLQPTPLSTKLEPFSNDWRIQSLQPDGDFLWMGTNRGLFKYDPKSETLRRYRYSTHRTGMLSQAFITDIKLTGEGHLIAATLNGLNVYHRESDTFEYIRPMDSQDPSATINCGAINCLFTVGETIWLGTDTGGINLLSPKRLQARLWDPGNDQWRMASINTLCEDAEGNLWVGGIGKGLMRWNPKGYTPLIYRFAPGDETSLSNNTLEGILIDSRQELWAYTWGTDISHLDLKHRHPQKIQRYSRENTPQLQSDFISSACEDTLNGGIWFGSARGLWFYSYKEGPLPCTISIFDGNEHEAIHALLADPQNRLWVGTTQGLFVADLHTFEYADGKIKLDYSRPKLDPSLTERREYINSILQDHNGHIWLGGKGGGLYRLDSTDRQKLVFSNWSAEQGLPAGAIISMAEDGDGYLWIVTTEGLTQVDTSTMTFTNYTEEDGFPTARYSWNCIHYSRLHSMLFLAGSAGVVMIRPSEVHPTPQPETTHVSFASLTVAGRQVFPAGDHHDYWGNPMRQRSTIRLHESESRFSIGLTSCDYGNSSRIRFAYRLKGYEKEWNETKPGDNSVRYTAVPPGHYILQARSTDESGQWSEQQAEVKVIITPYFYKTKSFCLAVLILIVAAAWFFYWWKMKNYREQKAKLEKKVEERTHKLAQQNQQLEAMARHIEEATEEKITFFTNITHEIRTPVTLIHGPIVHALKEVEDGHLKSQLEIAERNSGYLLSLVNELMDFRKLDKDKVTLERKPCHMEDFLSGVLMPFHLLAEERQITLRLFTHLPTPYLLIDVAYMRKAIVNLVSNAIKFTPDRGRIDLYAAEIKNAQSEELLYLSVCDTGTGVVEADKEKIFERFFQSKQTQPYPSHGQSGTGIGLFLCRKIVSLHGGTIYARNNHRQGASFRILMPLVRAASLATDPTPTTPESLQTLPAGTSPATGRHKDTILVVEDNKDMREYIVSLLDKEYRLLSAANGAEALDIVHKKQPDLIVSDLMMPVMDGMELSRRIKSDLSTSHIPFLMLTALQSQIQERKSLEIGVDEYLCKPFDEEVLRLHIRNILTLRSKYRQMFSTTGNIEEVPIQEETRDKQFVNKASRLMKEHYADSEYGVEAFVSDMGYSKTMVNNKLQALTGQPIGQFMKGYRLNVAQKMLQGGSGGTNVSEIAYAVGFNDPKYFTRCFKELFGYLPSSKLKKEG